jgi:hypothetical protein
MDTCTVETGLLSKKPCGQPAVTHCANCEQALCTKHAVAQVTPAGKRTGKFMCKECYTSWLQYEKSKPEPAPAKGAAPAPVVAAKAPAPAVAKKEEPKNEEPKKQDDDAPLEFTPTKKP